MAAPSLSDRRVAIVSSSAPYPASPPYDPPEHYPERTDRASERLDPTNRVYPAVRRLLRDLELDAERFGTPSWNPLGTLIDPGARVLLKPNWVLHQHLSGRDPFAVVTHTAVIRAVLDYVLIALDGRGRVLVADAPQANADWARLLEVTSIAETIDDVRRRTSCAVELLDLRRLTVTQRHGLTVARRYTDAETVLVDLGQRSALAPLGDTLINLCGSDYDRRATVGGHRHGHRYAAARPVLEAEVLISLPKLKVHKKTGVSINLKNMVGINADKNFIPHYRVGDARSGGDEFPDEESRLGRARDRVARLAIDNLLGRVDRVAAPVLSELLGLLHRKSRRSHALDASDAGYNQAVIKLFYRRFLGKAIRAGNWAGNDTLWRAIIDLNRIALYARVDGTLGDLPARRYLTIVDGVVGGEGEGPMDPDAVDSGVLIGGFNPVLVDIACTRLIGLDPSRIPLLTEALAACAPRLAPPASEPDVVSEPTVQVSPFRPPSGWPHLATATRVPA